MKVNRATNFRIGQFSNMTRLSVKALRLYDERGLLVPAHIDPDNGYRYYRAEQARSAEIIRVLRALDMPLPEIQAVVEALQKQDEQAVQAQLERHKQRLQGRLAAQEKALTFIDLIIQRKEIVMNYEIETTEQAEQVVAGVRIRTALSRISDDIAAGFGTLMVGLSAAQKIPVGAPMIAYHSVIDEETDGDIEILVPVDVLFEEGKKLSDDVYIRMLEGGLVATTTHHGPYDQVTPAYHAIVSWISEQGYKIVGPTREVYLNDPQQVAPAELLTRLDFPVAKAD